ncbi:TlpA family protein disulfide reductase [Sphingobacterium deserti]|nr:TlpA disulfide reductase family protein [Sphingobacterium deserti]
MKSLLLFMTMHISLYCLSQEKTTIEGSFVDYKKNDTLLFFSEGIPESYYERNNFKTNINDGLFTLDNNFKYPQLYFSLLASDRGKMFIRPKLFFFDNNTKNIKINYNVWQASTVDGHTASEYEKSFKLQAAKRLGVFDEDYLTNLLYQDFNKLDTFLYGYTKENNKSFVSLWILAQRFHFLGYSNLGQSTLSLFDQSVKKSPIWSKLNYDFENAPIKEGNDFPKISVETLDGNNVSFVLPKGKLILIDFWFSFCKPCIESIPKLKSLYDTYAPHGFEIVGISIDPETTKNKWKAVIEEMNISWQHFLDVEGVETKKLKVNQFPRYLLLDENGKILQTDVNLSKLEYFLKKDLSGR